MIFNYDNLLQHLQQIVNCKILVVGDVMLDQYWFGEVQRISPEAPVPIAKITQSDNRPGGAANVARNVASLGAQVTLLSVVGNDSNADLLEQILNNSGVNSYLLRDVSIKTIVKLRVLAKNQQLIRIDFEDTPSHEILSLCLENFNQQIASHDLLIISDYAKGGLTHLASMIAMAQNYTKPILIDPKGQNYQKYLGATILTPNKQELQDACGVWSNETELTLKIMKLIKQLQLEYVLLTRSEEGMSLFDRQGFKIDFAAHAQEIYDVSGAGDTVIATLATMLATGIAPSAAAFVANLAAGIVVSKLGTVAINQQELKQKIINLKK